MSYPILAPNSSWFTPNISTVTRGIITTINIVDSYTPSTTPTDSWDASVSQDGSIMCYLDGTTLTIAGNGSGKIAANEDSNSMFSDINKEDYFSALTELNGLSLIDFSNSTTIENIFRNLSSIENIDVSGIDVTNATTFKYAFRQCTKLSSIDLSAWNTSKCENIYGMFYNCINLASIDLTGWNTSNITDIGFAFDHCTSLTSVDVSNWNTSNITNMTSVFNYCEKLESIDVSKWDTSKVTSIAQFFQRCALVTSLDVSKWDTSSMTSMKYAFWGCNGLTRLAVENWDVSNVESFDHLFAHCNNLVVDVSNWKTSSKCKYYTCLFHTNANEYLDVSGFDTSGAISMAMMFEANVNLKKIKGLENFDTSNVCSFQEMFFNCHNLEELDLSSFDTRKADIVTSIRDGSNSPSQCTQRMLSGCRSLKKITLGENFTFAGDGTATGSQIGTLPTQNSTYVDGADGNWYTRSGEVYAPADVPNLTAQTYFASKISVDDEFLDRKGLVLFKDLVTNYIDEKDGEVLESAKAYTDEASNNLNTLNDKFNDHENNADIHFSSAEREKLAELENYTHPNSGVSEGTYKSVTVDAYGHITAGTNPTTLAGYGITDAETKGTVDTHNVANDAHNDIRLLVNELTTQVENFLDVDDTTKDQLSELIALIEENADDIESITSGKVNVSDIIDNLTTNVTNKPLSAAQGVAIKTLLDDLQDALDTLEENVNNTIIESVADWNQNDETAINYVKNRTHWVQHAKTILNAETFECKTQTSESNGYYCVKSGNIGLVNGNKYNVIVNGTTYTAVPALKTFDGNDIGLIVDIEKCRIYDRSNGTVEVFADTSSTLTVTITDAEDVYVPLDERFIPDTFARLTDVNAKMNAENPNGTGSLSLNRASGSVVGENSVTLGTDNIASGASSVAIGLGTSATGLGSYAEGSGTIASGDMSHASGQDSKAIGFASYAEGSSEANGDYSHASGYSIADGNYSYAVGNGTWAVGRSQTVIGEANIEDSSTDAATRGTYAFIIGNGDMDAGEFSNAATVDWNGNAWVSGNVYVGGSSQDGGSKLATETYVTDSLSSNSDLKTTELMDVVEGDEPTMSAIVDIRFIALENRVAALEEQLATAVARLSVL